MSMLSALIIGTAATDPKRTLPHGYSATFRSHREPGLPSKLPSHPPVLPKQGAVESGTYRNMFVEMGIDAAAVSQRVDAIFSQLFVTGDIDNERLLYEAADGSGSYIHAVDSDDVRSEGMSYAMMIAAQRDNKTMFDQVWRWAKEHMRHSGLDDERHGYFAWHCKPTGAVLDQNPASDGETWFASALYTAAARWGRADYASEAAALLDDCVNKTGNPVHPYSSIVNMFDNATGVKAAPASVVFVPYANSATFTDPSYHLPAFYEMWARHAPATSYPSRPFWEAFVSSSRSFFPLAVNAQTSLAPDYSTFAGAPTGSQRNFAFDAWRVAQNVAMDYAWLLPDDSAVGYCGRLHAFFAKQNATAPYGNQYDVDSGRALGHDHSPGLVAMNAVCALASNSTAAWDFVAELWSTPTPSGKYRYYDGMLFMLGWLQLAGQFQYFEAAAPIEQA